MNTNTNLNTDIGTLTDLEQELETALTAALDALGEHMPFNTDPVQSADEVMTQIAYTKGRRALESVWDRKAG